MADQEPLGQEQLQRQQQRESGTDWAEYDANAAPQISVGQAPEVVPAQGMKSLDGAVDVEADVRPPSASENKPPVPEHLPWGTRIRNSRLCSRRFLIPLLVLILVAVIVPVVLLRHRGGGGGAEHGTPVAAPSTAVSHATATDSSLASPATTTTSASSPVPECKSSDFRTDVNWIGIAGEVGWKFKLSDADNAEDCCEQCHRSTKEGCNGWLYMPGHEDDPGSVPPCNIIYGYSGPDEDDKCPGGKPDIVFAGASDSEDNFGGGGPCAGAVRGRR